MTQDEIKLLLKMGKLNKNEINEKISERIKLQNNKFFDVKLIAFLFCSQLLVVFNLIFQKIYLKKYMNAKSFQESKKVEVLAEIYLDIILLSTNQNSLVNLINFFDNLFFYQLIIFLVNLFVLISFILSKHFFKKYSYYLQKFAILTTSSNLFIQTEIVKIFLIIIKSDYNYINFLSAIQNLSYFSWQIFFNKNKRMFILGILINSIGLFGLGFYIVYQSIEKIGILLFNLALITFFYFYIYKKNFKKTEKKENLLKIISSLMDTIKSFNNNIIFFNNSGLSLLQDTIEDDINIENENQILSNNFYINNKSVINSVNKSYCNTYYNMKNQNLGNTFSNSNLGLILDFQKRNINGFSNYNTNNENINLINNPYKIKHEKKQNFQDFDYFNFLINFKLKISIKNSNFQNYINNDLCINNQNLNNNICINNQNLNYNLSDPIQNNYDTNINNYNNHTYNTINYHNCNNIYKHFEEETEQKFRSKYSDKMQHIYSNSLLNSTGKFINSHMNMDLYNHSSPIGFLKIDNIIPVENLKYRNPSMNNELKYSKNVNFNENNGPENISSHGSSIMTRVLQDFNLNINNISIENINNTSLPNIYQVNNRISNIRSRADTYNSNPVVPNNYSHNLAILNDNLKNKYFNLNQNCQYIKRINSINNFNIHNNFNKYEINNDNNSDFIEIPRENINLKAKTINTPNAYRSENSPYNLNIIEPLNGKVDKNKENTKVLNSEVEIKNNILKNTNSLYPGYNINFNNSGNLNNTDIFSKQNFSFAGTKRMNKNNSLNKSDSKISKSITISRKGTSNANNNNVNRLDSNLISLNDLLMSNMNLYQISNEDYNQIQEMEIIKNSTKNLQQQNY